MATEYQRQIATAKRMIAKKGAAVTWRSITDPTPVVGQPWKDGTSGDVDYDVKILFLPAGQRLKFAALAAGNDIPEGVELGYMASVDFVPSVRDSIIRGGVELRVTSIDPLQPDGTPILYELLFGT